MNKIKSLFDIKHGENIRFKTKIFGKEREIHGDFVDFCDNNYGWLIFLKNYIVEGVIIDEINDDSQEFPISYGTDIYYSEKKSNSK
jgi:hypothetical protein